MLQPQTRHLAVASPSSFPDIPLCTSYIVAPSRWNDLRVTSIHHRIISALLVVLRHHVKSTTVLEPTDLTLVEGMHKFDIKRRTILGMNFKSHRLSDRKFCTHQVKPISGVNLIIIGRIVEGQGKHSLLLEIGLVLVPVSNSLAIFSADELTIRAKLRVMIATPPRCLGSRAACSLELPSP